MTDEQINSAIAEACGWTDIHDSGVLHQHKFWGYPPLKEWQKWRFFDPLPNYCADLNAMHEAEKLLFTGSQKLRWKYVAELHITAEPTGWGNYAGAHATARQRAEAFLRALGKWEQ